MARRTAEYLGAQFHPVHVDEMALASAFEDTIWASESPLPDLCGGGKFIMAEAVHRHGIKVVLTGEGADEHLAGYRHYPLDALRERDSSWPASSTTEAGRVSTVRALDQQGICNVPGYMEAANRMLNHSCTARHAADFCFLPFARWTDIHAKLHPLIALAETFDGRTRDLVANRWHPLHTAEYMSIKTFMLAYILRNAGDNVDMMHQVESRPPFLDHHVTEYANGIPPSLKLPFNPTDQSFREKHILREAMRPFITEEVYASRKKPYAAPSKYEVNGPIHQLFTRLVTKENVDNLGFLDWGQTKEHLDKSFGDSQNELSFRATLSVAQYVVLSQRFGVAPARNTPKNGLYDERMGGVKWLGFVLCGMRRWVSDALSYLLPSMILDFFSFNRRH